MILVEAGGISNAVFRKLLRGGQLVREPLSRIELGSFCLCLVLFVCVCFCHEWTQNTTPGGCSYQPASLPSPTSVGGMIPADAPWQKVETTGERYLSTPLFEGVNEGSDDDWLDSLD